MSKQTIITIGNYQKKQFFFSIDHYQAGLSNNWVPVTAQLPFEVKPREALPTGIITNKEEYKKVFYLDYKEIPNPDPKYQA